MSDTRELLLAIDTSAGTSVAVVDVDRGVLSEANGYDTMKHAEVIGRLIEEALAEASVSAADITAVVAGMGPGPFTGLRVGIAAAHAFATGLGIELLPVVSHDAVARSAQAEGHSGDLLVVSDARRREVYWSLYTLAEAGSAAAVADRPDAAAAATDRPDGGAAAVADRLAAAPVSVGESGSATPPVRLDGPGLAKPDALPHPYATRRDAAHVSAAALGLVAADLLRAGNPFADDRALYLRSPDVTISTGTKRVTQR